MIVCLCLVIIFDCFFLCPFIVCDCLFVSGNYLPLTGVLQEGGGQFLQTSGQMESFHAVGEVCTAPAPSAIYPTMYPVTSSDSSPANLASFSPATFAASLVPISPDFFFSQFFPPGKHRCMC